MNRFRLSFKPWNLRVSSLFTNDKKRKYLEEYEEQAQYAEPTSSTQLRRKLEEKTWAELNSRDRD